MIRYNVAVIPTAELQKLADSKADQLSRMTDNHPAKLKFELLLSIYWNELDARRA